MNAHQLFLTNWAKKYCPDFMTIVPAGSEFIALTVGEGADRFTQVFMRSTFTNWEAHPNYDDIIAGCTTEGRELFGKMLEAETYSVVSSSNGVIFGGVSGASAIKSNLALGTPARARLVAALGTYDRNQPYCKDLKNLGAAVVPSDVFVESSYVKKMVQALIDTGHIFKGPFPSTEAAKPLNGRTALERSRAISVEMLNKCGPSGFPMHWMMDPAGTDYYGDQNNGNLIKTPYFYVVEAQDDSVAEFYAQKGTESWVLNGKAVAHTLLDVNAGALGAEFDDMIVFAQRLNPTLAPTTARGIYGFTRLDVSWLPLCVLPGKHSILVRSAPENVSFSNGDLDGPRMISLGVPSADIVGVMPVAWYVDYANQQIADGAKNATELATAVKDMDVYASKSITFIDYNQPVFLQSDLVYLTQLYHDYKKAKEKACEEDDFANVQFTSTMKYGELNTLINGSRSTKVFFGYRDAAERPVMDTPLPVSMSGWVLTGGTAVVTARRPDGTFAPSYAKDNGDEFVNAIALGASLSGTTVDAQLAIWGLDPTIVNGQTAGLSEVHKRLSGGLTSGSPTAYFDFRWESVGITGIPDIRNMAGDAGYRAAMISKGAVAPLGTYLKDILYTEVRGFYAGVLLAVSS